MNHRFQIVVAKASRSEAGHTTPLSPFGRFKTLLAGFALAIVALSVLVASVVLGYIIAVILSLFVIVVIAVFLLKALFRRRRTATRLDRA